MPDQGDRSGIPVTLRITAIVGCAVVIMGAATGNLFWVAMGCAAIGLSAIWQIMQLEDRS